MSKLEPSLRDHILEFPTGDCEVARCTKCGETFGVHDNPELSLCVPMRTPQYRKISFIDGTKSEPIPVGFK